MIGPLEKLDFYIKNTKISTHKIYHLIQDLDIIQRLETYFFFVLRHQMLVSLRVSNTKDPLRGCIKVNII